MVDSELKPAQGVACVADTGDAVLTPRGRAPVERADAAADGSPAPVEVDIELTMLVPSLDEAATSDSPRTA